MSDAPRSGKTPDRSKRPNRLVVFSVAAVGLLALAFVFIAGVLAVAANHGPDSDPVAHSYDVPPSMAATFAAQYATRKLGWQIARTDASRGTATLMIPRGFGTGLVAVVATPDGKGTRVAIQTSSRTGFGPDWGAKARHQRALDLQSGMDDKLPPLR